MITNDGRRDTIPCVLCREVPPGGLPYRSYDGVQVFVCDKCNDRVQPLDGDLDLYLWHLAIDKSRVTAEMYRDVRSVLGG